MFNISCGIVGMGAVVAATTQGPLTAIWILLEMTGDDKIILPVVAADHDHRLTGVVSRRDILGAYDKAVLKKFLFSK